MKRMLLIAGLAGLLTACNQTAKQAQAKLEEAYAAFEQRDYNGAKLILDEIKTSYPKAYDVRREGQALQRKVEQQELAQTLHYLDSVMASKQQELTSMKARYAFEKDEAYESMGHYLAPSQVIEKNANRSFLRFRVDEEGVLKLTSIYVGGRYIHHIGIKVTAPDGSFAETPAAKESYETSNLDRKIEKADFKQGEDGNVMSFIYLNRDKNLRVSYQGESPYAITLNATDRKALADCYELAQVLSDIAQIKKEREEAQLKKDFIDRRIEKTTRQE